MIFRIKDNTRLDLFLIFTLFLPVFWEQLASVLLSVLSSVISSNIDTTYLNVTSLVGSVVGPLTTLYASIASGASILMSQYMGASDTERSKKLFSTSNILGLSVSLLISFLIVFFHNPVLRAFYPNMSESFFKNGAVYSIFLAFTVPMTFFRTNVIGILRGALNTKGPLYISLFGGVIDLFLRFLFMIFFDMGIVGLGLASVISNIVFTLISLYILHKSGQFKGCFLNAFKFYDKTVAKESLKIGGVMCIQSFVVSISALILNQILATMGDIEISAYNIVVSCESLIHLAPNAMAYVAQIIAGKYMGAGEEKRAYKLSVFITSLTTVLSILISIIAFPLSSFLVGLYTSDKLITSISSVAFRVGLLTSTLFWSAGNVLSAGIRGAGNVKYPAFVLILSSFVYKIPATWYFCVFLNKGAVGRIFVNSLEQLVYALFFVAFAVIKFRKIKKRELNEEKYT